MDGTNGKDPFQEAFRLFRYFRLFRILSWSPSPKAQFVTVPGIVLRHPHLSLAQIYAALAYYYEHQPEMDAEIQRRSPVNKIKELAKLPENWDGYGSRPIQSGVLTAAKNLLPTLDQMGLRYPQVFPVPGGGIQLEWQNERGELELEILPDGEIAYLIVDERGQMREGSLRSRKPGLGDD